MLCLSVSGRGWQAEGFTQSGAVLRLEPSHSMGPFSMPTPCWAGRGSRCRSRLPQKEETSLWLPPAPVHVKQRPRAPQSLGGCSHHLVQGLGGDARRVPRAEHGRRSSEQVRLLVSPTESLFATCSKEPCREIFKDYEC